MDEKINIALLDDNDSGPQIVRKKRKLNESFFSVMLRFTEIMMIYLVPSFIASYITMYLPKEGSWKMCCFFAFCLAMALHIWCGVDFYRRVNNSYKKYLIISLSVYIPVGVLSFLMYDFIEENLLLYNFVFSMTRAFELFYPKTLYSMMMCHFCLLAAIAITPVFLFKTDREKAEMAKLVEESQTSFDEMGMVFNPDELPDLPPDPDNKSNEEKPLGMLFNPDELPDVVESIERVRDAVDGEYMGGLLFDPDELPDISRQEKDEDKNTGLLFNPDEIREPAEHIMNVTDGVDGEYMGGLLFDPDEMPEQIKDDSYDEQEKTEGRLLFDPDETSDEMKRFISTYDGVDEGYSGGLLFDPDEL